MSVTDQFFFDLFTCALEGGIDYWAEVDEYHLWLDGVEGVDDLDGFFARITDAEDDDHDRWRVDRDVIARGYNLATTSHRDKIAWSVTGRPPDVVTAESVDDWGYDASDADAIVQLGLFGEVRYG